MSDDSPLWVVGDVQGFLQPLQLVLSDVELIDPTGTWIGGSASLYVLGDLVDRGPDGIGVIELLMRLQREAPNDGGRVEVVIGNHDILLAAACKFGERFRKGWLDSGGVVSDLERLTGRHVSWLCALPAMRLERDVLMQHADALFYTEYGSTLDEVNSTFRRILQGDDGAAWDQLLDAFSEHRAFLGSDGCANLDRFLETFGGRMLVHGHTPIPKITQQAPETATAPFVYCDGRCLNVDPGIYLGGRGFAYKVNI